MAKFVKYDYLKEIEKSKDAVVKMRGVDLWFGKPGRGIHAIKNMSLNLEKNEILGIVGESGSGKSTTGNSIIGLVDRQEGSILVNNEFEVPKKSKDLKGKKNNYLVNNVQMILQDPTESLNPNKTIYKVVVEGLINTDIRANFLRLFDGETIKSLKAIITNSKQSEPKILKAVSVEYLIKLIESENIDELRKILYERPINELKDSKREIDYQIYTLLTHKFDERRKYIVHGKIKKSKAIKKIATDIVESIGLSRNTFKRYPLEFSGGQQQRIGIARAIALRPKILIADEPISALDVSIQAQVVNIIKDLRKTYNLSIIFIAHDLKMVEYISDRIAVMYRGQIVEMGDPKEIVNNPIHPYTKALIDSIPSINNGEMIISTIYNPALHNYNEVNKPRWYKVESDKKNHLVFASAKELADGFGGHNV